MSARVVEGDCIALMRTLPESCVDSIVCDPPYGLGFMGKDRDSPGGTGDFPMRRTAATNTVNTGVSRQGGRQRSTEDFAKRQARDARGFQEWCVGWAEECLRVLRPGGHLLAFGSPRTYHRLASGIEDSGFEVRDSLMWIYGQGFPKSRNLDGDWNGWGTALKPAFEPIVVARKSLVGTVAANVLEHGTGALNIDGCRVGRKEGDRVEYGRDSVLPSGESVALGKFAVVSPYAPHDSGRWPANVILDEEAAELLDEQTGESTSRSGKPRKGKSGEGWGMSATGAEHNDSGGASRFFYCAKANTKERSAGLDGKNVHPTVKPIDVMRWLVRLVTPPGGRVLDPFCGSGTTGIAAVLEGFEFGGFEIDPEYVEIARARIAHWEAA